ncbi:MAG: bifunctional shikimate kinase/3-dehydroquinate synthase [Thermodesulfobacteriota bacterium]
MKSHIYLTGFMGSGKTTVGRVLAELLNRKFLDTDPWLEREFGKAIPQVFRDDGEETFRVAERLLLSSLSAEGRLVVATGGGMPVDRANRVTMRESGRIVYLDASVDACLARLAPEERDARPLWQDVDAVRQLFAHRKEAYADHDLMVSVDGKDPLTIAKSIISGLFPDREFCARLGDWYCPIIWTWDAPTALSKFVRESRCAILTDSNVMRHRLDAFLGSPWSPIAMEVEPGESSKTLDIANRVYEQLLAEHFDRDDLLVALGGGVVTDLGAYVASTFKRGMRFVLVSTSLLGCVDAAIGGKAAVNLGAAKNVIGCFSTPDAVILDIAALRSLSRSQVSEGLIEAYKTGLVASAELAELVEGEAQALLAGDQPLLAEVADMAARTKAGVVSNDFRESGLRRILNFGHTYGHGVEGACGFGISHGQSVAEGMKVAAELSAARGLIPHELAARIAATVAVLSPEDLDRPRFDDVWEIMRHDKKIKAGKLVFVLLEGLGRPICVDDVSRDELRDVVDRVVSNGGRKGCAVPPF